MSTTVPDESELTRFYSLFPQPALARDLFNLIEGLRVDNKLRAAYPGIRRDMDMIRAASAEDRPDLASLPEVSAVVEALLQHTLGLDTDLSALPPAVQSAVVNARELLAEMEDTDSTVSDAADLTARVYLLIERGSAERDASRMPGGASPEPPPGMDPGEGGEGEGDRPEGQPPDVDGLNTDEYEEAQMPPYMTPIMEELVKQRPELAKKDPTKTGETQATEEGEGENPDLAEDADKAMNTSEVEIGQGDQAGDEVAQSGEAGDDDIDPGAGDAGKNEETEGGGKTPEQAGLASAPAQEDDADVDLGEREFLYDEWDFKIEDYRPSWVTLREHRATRMQEGFVAATFHEYGGIVTQIRRSFQLMRPERMRKMRFQTEGDDLDTEGLVEYVVDRRARVTPSGRVYIQRDKRERDVTTAFLIDMSSSTDRKVDGRKRVMDLEKEGLLLMCEALEAIRDEYCIYGFSGDGREDAEFFVVKELGERYDDRVKGRIGGIYARRKTRMGPAIRHTAARLAAADSAVKVMILLTDGKPYDSDTYQDNQYAQEDTKMALREAKRDKIHLFCVTVDTEGADYLPHMYSDANFVVIDDIRTLPQRLPQLYRRLTT